MHFSVKSKNYKNFSQSQKNSTNPSQLISCISPTYHVQNNIQAYQNDQYNGQINLHQSNLPAPVRLFSIWQIDTQKSTTQNCMIFISDSVLDLHIIFAKAEFQNYFSIFSGISKSTVCCRFSKQCAQ